MGIKHMNRIEEALRAARKSDRVLSAYMDQIFRETRSSSSRTSNGCKATSVTPS